MSDNVKFMNIEEDDDKTVFQTEEDLKKIEEELSDLSDDDTTFVDPPHQKTIPNRPYWQSIFG